MYKFTFFVFFIIFAFLFTEINKATPGRNGTTPGCTGGGCHIYVENSITVTKIDSLTVEIKVLKLSSGRSVAGELVNSSGAVVASVNKTTKNPFQLKAAEPGVYLVNAGNWNPLKSWDSATVDLTAVTSVNNNSDLTGLLSNSAFPNPFKLDTKLKMYLENDCKVELKVFDLIGNAIDRVEYGNLNKGAVELQYNGSKLPAGGYYFVISYDNGKLSFLKIIKL